MIKLTKTIKNTPKNEITKKLYLFLQYNFSCSSRSNITPSYLIRLCVHCMLNDQLEDRFSKMRMHNLEKK